MYIKYCNAYGGLIWGINDTHVTIDNDSGFLLKHPNRHKTYKISENPINPYDLSTNIYDSINNLLSNVINVFKF